MSRVALYRHFDADGRLLYVGVSENIVRRGKEHSAKAAWVHLAARAEAEWFRDRESAIAAEAEAIRREFPAFNIAMAEAGAKRDACEVTDLRSWLSAAGVRQADIAKHIGVSVPHLSKMMTGAMRPCLKTAWLIECATGGCVPISSWTAGFPTVPPMDLAQPKHAEPTETITPILEPPHAQTQL